jgi:hypothetical protein
MVVAPVCVSIRAGAMDSGRPFANWNRPIISAGRRLVIQANGKISIQF